MQPAPDLNPIVVDHPVRKELAAHLLYRRAGLGGGLLIKIDFEDLDRPDSGYRAESEEFQGFEYVVSHDVVEDRAPAAARRGSRIGFEAGPCAPPPHAAGGRRKIPHPP